MLSGIAAPDLCLPFDRIDFPSGGTVIAAISGGSDSTALLLLLAEHLKTRSSECRLVAVTVDHKLRAESASEAVSVARLCERFGIEHRIKVWDGAKPATGLSAAAREARYRLLCEAADETGASLLLTGHTADDQAETVAMRHERGDGRGLAGMAPATLVNGRHWLMRPLLGSWRQELRDWLDARQIGWIDDPSNLSMKSERVRARFELAKSDEAGRWLAVATQAGEKRIELGRHAASIIGAHASQPMPGLLRVGSSFAGGDREAAIYALRILVAVTGGRQHLPDLDATSKLLDLAAAPPLRTTLSRAVIDIRRDAIWLHRENRDLPKPQAATDGLVWDGRYRVAARQCGWGLSSQQAAGSAAPAGIPPILWRGAMKAQPVFFAGRGDADPAPGPEVEPVAAPWAGFLPSFDLAPARAVLRLVSGTISPPLPFVDERGSEL